jgi:rhamnosyltransferase
VIDSASDDDTPHIAQKVGVELLEIQRADFNHAATRNLALNYEADFYLFMTQDAIPYDDKLIENLLKAFDDPDVVVSYARQIPHADADLIEKFARETNYPDVSVVKSKESLPSMGIKTFFCSNSCAMYRASYFKEVGGFEEGLIMNEDMAFAARAILDGKKVAYVAEAKVWHSHAYGAGDIFQRYFDIGIFFKRNRWIVKAVNRYASTESTGAKQVKKELAYLARSAPWLLPKSILFSSLKYIAFKMGMQYEQLPKSIVKKFSLHKNFHT